jgi:hypothetical protein
MWKRRPMNSLHLPHRLRHAWPLVVNSRAGKKVNSNWLHTCGHTPGGAISKQTRLPTDDINGGHTSFTDLINGWSQPFMLVFFNLFPFTRAFAYSAFHGLSQLTAPMDWALAGEGGRSRIRCQIWPATFRIMVSLRRNKTKRPEVKVEHLP